jgi:hypothetical protein
VGRLLPDVILHYLTFINDTRLTLLGQQNRSVPWFFRSPTSPICRSLANLRWTLWPVRSLGCSRNAGVAHWLMLAAIDALNQLTGGGLIRRHRGTFIFG